MTFPKLIDGAQPFFLPGGPTGCLLIHGFTGMPYEMKGLGKHLAAQGYTVLGPRLTHHGSQPADMNRSRWPDWYFAALDGWFLLRGVCERVVVIGLSMGGATALLLAANQPVAAVVAMSTPVRPPDRRMPLARFVHWILAFAAKPQEETAESLVPSYQVYPVRAVVELVKYLQVVEEALPRIKAPALLMHARGDSSVSPDNLDRIYGRIGSADKQKVWLERGDHLVTEDEDKEAVYAHVVAFLRRMEGAT